MKKLRVALVHDYIKEYGGAERVLEVLCEMYPDAPIYTAFYVKGSACWGRFRGRDIRPSWAHYVPFFASKLHSPLRFLAPLIWGSFDLSKYDVVISSASWYVTKGFGRRGKPAFAKGYGEAKPIEICYCHTPPRWLYGYRTSVEWQRFWLVRLYGMIVGHFMRMYDFKAAQRVDYFVANSEEVRGRIRKFYGREARVIYPPVGLLGPAFAKGYGEVKDYYFIVSRIVGSKGIEVAVEAARKYGFRLKIAGAGVGYYGKFEDLKRQAGESVDFLGQVSDEELVELYRGAKAFLALARDEDFGITPVEAMLCGTPVIAFRGGGYLETVVEGKTGVFFDEASVESLGGAIKKFEKMRIDKKDCVRQAEKFSKERFKRELSEFFSYQLG
jgi:glycosyltransferase involved in cell wall biosynthesis